MKVAGHATLDAPRDEVFAAICDPGVLLDVIPGCDDIRRISNTEYRGRIALRLPGIAGSFDTVVRLTRTDPPEFGAFEGTVEGRPGSVAGHASFRLSEVAGGTSVDYEGDGLVGGPLARLDSRFLDGVVTRMIDDGLVRLGRRLQRRSPGIGPTEGGREPDRSPTEITR